LEQTKTTANYKLIHKVKDDKFDVDHLHHYNLHIQIGPRDLQFAVVDNETNRCLLLEDYILASVGSYQDLQVLLSNIFDQHHLLTAGFWKKVRIGIKNNKFSLIPAPLFVKDALVDYLSINSKVDPDKEKILYYKHIHSDAICVFAVHRVLYDWLSGLYPNAEVGFVHQSSSLIEGVINYGANHRNDSMFIYIDRFKLHVLTLRDQNLEYYNQFVIKEFNDYIKYIMLVLKGLHRDQKKSKVALWGYIGRDSAHFKEFHRYIQNLSFGDRPKYLEFGYVFDEVQDHQYFDLYSMHLCD
jgi:hypothetical protein